MSLALADLPSMMRRVEHFRRLSEVELLGIVEAGEICHKSREETIFVEGEPPAGLFVILEGQVELCKYGPEGQLSIVSVVEPVTMFNEVAALDGGANPVTAVAGQDSALWRLPPEGLHDLILHYPHLALGLLHVLAARNRFLTARFEDLSFRPVVGRVALLLLRLSANGANAIDRRRHSNSRMAAMVSTGPEAFSRALRLLREERAVACTERTITVLNRELLGCFAR